MIAWMTGALPVTLHAWPSRRDQKSPRMTRAKAQKYAKEEGERGILMKRTMTNRIVLAAVLLLLACGQASAQTDPLPSWNDGAAKKSITDFVRTTTGKGRQPEVRPAPEVRIAVFDQDLFNSN